MKSLVWEKIDSERKKKLNLTIGGWSTLSCVTLKMVRACYVTYIVDYKMHDGFGNDITCRFVDDFHVRLD